MSGWPAATAPWHSSTRRLEIKICAYPPGWQQTWDPVQARDIPSPSPPGASGHPQQSSGEAGMKGMAVSAHGSPPDASHRLMKGPEITVRMQTKMPHIAATRYGRRECRERCACVIKVRRASGVCPCRLEADDIDSSCAGQRIRPLGGRPGTSSLSPHHRFVSRRTRGRTLAILRRRRRSPAEIRRKE